METSQQQSATNQQQGSRNARGGAGGREPEENGETKPAAASREVRAGEAAGEGTERTKGERGGLASRDEGAGEFTKVKLQ